MSLHGLSCFFNSSTPVWSEILTGVSWSGNGCAGFSRPIDSLNKLAVFSEGDLLSPISLIDDSGPLSPVVINVPLVEPRKNRYWLSDGSLPTNKLVSPKVLNTEPIFAQYLPRPYPSHAYATASNHAVLVHECIALERHRLSCAVALFDREKFSSFVYRLTIFDLLSHILGTGFLQASDLTIFGALKSFLSELDDALAKMMRKYPKDVSIVSAFSHTACTNTVNLNLLLANGRFLSVTDAAAQNRADDERMRVAELRFGWEPSSHHLTTLEGRLNTSSTLAASPVSGCVYINRKNTFKDGAVTESDYLNVRLQVENYLRSALKQFGSNLSIQTYQHDSNSTIAPDLVVSVKGVEFQNLSADALPITPLTTHDNEGFALLPKARKAPEKIRTTQLASLLIA